MAKPLIDHVLWTLGRGGAERMVFDLARRLPEEGFEIRVLAAGGAVSSSNGGDMAEDFRRAGIQILINPDTGTSRRRSAVRFLRAAIRERRPAIWHSHLTPVWAGMAARTAFVRPWIATAHGFESGLPFASRLARRFAYGSVDHVVCVSQAVRDSVRRQYGVAPMRSSVISPGIDLKRFIPRESRLPSDVPQLVTVGRLSPEKGLDTLFEALAEVKRPWRLLVIGDGPEHMRLSRLAESLGILPRVRFAGPVPDPAPHLRASDLFCFPSREEGQGMALLEAAAVRLPAVSSDIPAVREAFGQDAVAYAVPGDISSWTKAIELALSRYPEALERARRAHDIVAARFTLDEMVEKHAHLYKSLL